MRLHESRVAERVEGCGDADAAVGFLEDNGEDETGVCVCGVGDCEGGGVDGVDFWEGVRGDVPDFAGVED